MQAFLELVPEQPLIDNQLWTTVSVPPQKNKKQNCPPWELQAETERRVKAFLEGCGLAWLQPHFVLDMGFESEEARGTPNPKP